ncbi:MAG: ABC transporter ATP-binding protein [Rhabdochlamydiaceae bacterium]|nr:ABC transporter ATP-binding protein [Rhabdochlamydiaceae bacterium]
MSILLDVKDLHVQFSNRLGEVRAVSGVNFQLKEGEILGIVGESGCGKSTLAKALVHLLPSHSAKMQGEILFQGLDLLKCKEEELLSIRGKEIGFIFQDPMTSLNPTMKIGEQIIEGYLKHHPHISKKEALAYAAELLTTVGISQPSERLFEYPHTMSGGMRQKVTIALALASRPKILIADEPTTALDATIQAQILSFISSLQKLQNTSIILITHDLSVVAGFCDRVIVMYAGQIVEVAPVEELFYDPKHPYTQRLLKTIPRIDLPKDTVLSPIEGSPPLLHMPWKGCAFAPRCLDALPHCKTAEPPLYTMKNECSSRCWLREKESS